MARIAPAPAEQVEALFGPDVPLRVRIYAQRPEIAVKFLEFGRTLREERLLPDRLIELVRLRAQLVRLRDERAILLQRAEEAEADPTVSRSPGRGSLSRNPDSLRRFLNPAVRRPHYIPCYSRAGASPGVRCHGGDGWASPA